jgi:hypothetical protein
MEGAVTVQSVFPAQCEIVFGLFDVASQRDQIDVQFLQVKRAAHLLLHGGTVNHHGVRSINSNHGGLEIDHGIRVVGHDGIDDATGFFVSLKGNEYV